jgi:two-component system, LytTR family, response regulator
MTKILKAVVVDDERLARRELRSLLEELDGVTVVGEADSVESAEGVIEKTAPDVVFLDIHLGPESGFDLLDRMESDCDVVFVTAHDAYAIRAFEVNALDYLLKPVNPERLARAIERLSVPRPIPAARQLEYGDRIFLETDGHPRFVKLETIVCLVAADDHSELFTSDGGKTLVLKSLREWEERLPERHFPRIHRSTIINLEYVERIEAGFNRAYRVFLRGFQEPFAMSRRHASKLKQTFG